MLHNIIIFLKSSKSKVNFFENIIYIFFVQLKQNVIFCNKNTVIKIVEIDKIDCRSEKKNYHFNLEKYVILFDKISILSAIDENDCKFRPFVIQL